MVVLKLLDRSIGIVSMVILARLLVPADFGLVAMATAIIAIIELLSAFNFDIGNTSHGPSMVSPQAAHYWHSPRRSFSVSRFTFHSRVCYGLFRDSLSPPRPASWPR
jgi:hypothetical protein